MTEIDNFNDIDGLAALIQACDVIVTVSNTTAHLAAALGKPVLIMLPFSPGLLCIGTLSAPIARGIPARGYSGKTRLAIDPRCPTRQPGFRRTVVRDVGTPALRLDQISFDDRRVLYGARALVHHQPFVRPFDAEHPDLAVLDLHQPVGHVHDAPIVGGKDESGLVVAIALFHQLQDARAGFVI